MGVNHNGESQRRITTTGHLRELCCYHPMKETTNDPNAHVTTCQGNYSDGSRTTLIVYWAMSRNISNCIH
jgi:hypothetical protein